MLTRLPNHGLTQENADWQSRWWANLNVKQSDCRHKLSIFMTIHKQVHCPALRNVHMWLQRHIYGNRILGSMPKQLNNTRKQDD